MWLRLRSSLALIAMDATEAAPAHALVQCVALRVITSIQSQPPRAPGVALSSRIP